MTEHKKQMGQFMTTRYNYILQNLFIPSSFMENKEPLIIVEPFCGEGHLLNILPFQCSQNYILECYDIEPKKDYIISKNTLLDPPCYNNKYIITNPPYLARNKTNDKTIFDKYDENDLYKCFLRELLSNKCLGGILILPLNFWCSIRANDILLRCSFLKVYEIQLLNIFEETVFEDTNYTICSFQFILRTDVLLHDKREHVNNIKINIYPNPTQIEACIHMNNSYLIGGDIYHLPLSTTHVVSRLTTKNQTKQHTNIFVKCIDDNEQKQIACSIVSDHDIYIDTTPNLTARSFATLVIDPPISLNCQRNVVEKFNSLLREHRKKYHSLFLVNYRESKDIARKRISFDLVYRIISHILIDCVE